MGAAGFDVEAGGAADNFPLLVPCLGRRKGCGGGGVQWLVSGRFIRFMLMDSVVVSTGLIACRWCSGMLAVYARQDEFLGTDGG